MAANRTLFHPEQLARASSVILSAQDLPSISCSGLKSGMNSFSTSLHSLRSGSPLF
ncbi:hypothetical protein APY03_0483 [Variovorax sp. WDL1]|nr:hypothetical protein APY03_0483 [Variovorax sp. WDL1]